jgi:hypothetical protein
MAQILALTETLHGVVNFKFCILTSTVSGIFALSLVIGISCIVPCNCYVLYCAVQQVLFILSLILLISIVSCKSHVTGIFVSFSP